METVKRIKKHARFSFCVYKRATLVCTGTSESHAGMHRYIREPHWSVGPTCISESHTGIHRYMREPHWSVGPTCISESHTGMYGLHANQRATLVCMAYMHIREPHWSVWPTCKSESHTGM